MKNRGKHNDHSSLKVGPTRRRAERRATSQVLVHIMFHVSPGCPKEGSFGAVEVRRIPVYVDHSNWIYWLVTGNVITVITGNVKCKRFEGLGPLEHFRSH